MAIQKPTNPTEAMFQGLETGFKIGKHAAAVVEDRRQKQEYTAIMAEMQPQIDALDNEMVLAQAKVDEQLDKMRTGEFVSQKDLNAALYGSTVGNFQIMHKKMDLVNTTISKYATNRYVSKGLGQMAQGLATQMDSGLKIMNDGMDAMAAAANVDTSAFAAQTGRQAQEGTQAYQEGSLGMRGEELGEKTRHAKVGERQADEAGGRAADALALRGREVATGEARENRLSEFQDRKLTMAEESHAQKKWSQGLEDLGELSAIVNKAQAHGMDLGKIAEQLSTPERPLTEEDLLGLADKYSYYGKETTANLREVDQRILAAQKGVEGGDPEANEDLRMAQKKRQLLVESDRAMQRAFERTATAETLPALEHLIYGAVKKYKGSVQFIEDLSYIGSPIEYLGRTGNQLGTALTLGDESADSPAKEAAKKVYGK